jgi:hypothetical protein
MAIIHASPETTASSPGTTAASRRRPRRRLVSLGAALAALALFAAACSDDDDTVAGDAGTESGESGESGGGGGDGDMTISIAAPADGDTVGDSFDVEVESETEFGEPDTGLHHVHLYYDGNVSEDQSEYDIVYGNSFTVERDLGPGEHTIEAIIANADHSLTDVSDEVTVTVGEGGGGGGDTPTTSEDDGGAYDY